MAALSGQCEILSGAGRPGNQAQLPEPEYCRFHSGQPHRSAAVACFNKRILQKIRGQDLNLSLRYKKMLKEKMLKGLGCLEIMTAGPLLAGSRASIALRYTAGPKGLKKGGSLRITIPHGFTT